MAASECKRQHAAATQLAEEDPRGKQRGRQRADAPYFLVHSLAVDSYRARSVLYRLAISGTRGSSGFGSVRSEQIERRTA